MKQGKTSFLLIFGLLFLLGISAPYNAVTAYAADNRVPGTGMLTGKVTATKSFEAAKVYAHNLDKDMIYMVYTGDGFRLWQAVSGARPRDADCFVAGGEARDSH